MPSRRARSDPERSRAALGRLGLVGLFILLLAAGAIGFWFNDMYRNYYGIFDACDQGASSAYADEDDRRSRGGDDAAAQRPGPFGAKPEDVLAA